MDLMELLKTRRTYRRFDQEKKIPAEVIADMKESLRLASCAGNFQQLRYVFITDPEMVEKIFPETYWAAALPKELGTPKDGEHPVMYVAVIYDPEKSTKHITTDSGLAMSNMTLAAWSHGVGSCIMANYHRDHIKALLSLPENMEIHMMVAFGYPTHTSTIVEAQAGGSLNYYLDEEKQYYVPKLTSADLIREI